jgi:hypothetical protein
MGVRDFVLRRFGDCPEQVRAMTRQWSAARQRATAGPATSPQGQRA